MKLTKRYIAGAASALVLSLGLSACGGSGSSGSASSAEGAEGSTSAGATQCGTTSTAPISWMTMLHSPTTPSQDGPVMQGLKEHTGEDFTIQWVPDASKEEKLNSAIASGNLADMTSLTLASTSSTIRKALDSGMFWDVEPYLDEFPNLGAIDPDLLDLARVNGKLYGVPFQSDPARMGVLVRQDWLDELGLEVPHTLDELRTVAEAFKENKGGAIIDRAESFKVGFPQIAGYFGAGDKFTVDEDGNIVSVYGTDAWKDAMKWYADMYADGLINQEFVTMQKQNQEDAVVQGKGGIVFTMLTGGSNYAKNARSADPNTTMDWAIIDDMTEGDVPRRIVSDTNGGYGGLIGISKSKVKCEEDMLRILGFMDKLMDEESYQLMSMGIEGEHFILNDDGTTEVPDRDKKDQEVGPFNGSNLGNWPGFPSSDAKMNEGKEKIKAQAEYAVSNPTVALDSEAYDKEYSLIEQNIQDAYNKFIMGNITMADYEKVIADQEAKGLKQIEEEFTESKQVADAAKNS